MNIQLANVISDVSGMTGQAIVKAILAGERDSYQLAALRNWRVKSSEEEIARSLEGNWQEDLLFVLQQEQDGYEFCEKQMAECDQRLQQYLQQQEDRIRGAGLPQEKRKERFRKKKKGNAPQFDLRAELFRMTGTDLTQIDRIDVTTTMTILREAGWDMSKWKTEHHFVSWLRLCPDNRISGDKIIGKARLPTNNRVTNALRMAASTLRLSDTYLGAQFRRLRTKLGAPVAIKAMAAKLARLVYRMLRYAIHRPRSGVLRRSAPQTANQLSQTQRRQSRIPNHRSSGSVVSGELAMTKALTHPITLLLTLALASVFLQQAAAQERSTLDTKKGADSLDRFAGTWEGKCQDGATFVVIVLHVTGSQLEGTIRIGNMGGDHNGACVSVSDPPAPEHAQKINEASAQQNILSFKGAKRPDGTSSRFELTQTQSDKAELKLFDTPVADHPWQLVRVQKP